jgi:hypothetical protein
VVGVHNRNRRSATILSNINSCGRRVRWTRTRRSIIRTLEPVIQSGERYSNRAWHRFGRGDRTIRTRRFTSRRCQGIRGNSWAAAPIQRHRLTRERKMRMSVNLERRRAWRRKWEDKNRDKINAQKRARKQLDAPAKKAWNRANPVRLKGYELKKKYGITKLDYDEMLVRQHGACAICGCKNKSKWFYVDHCHSTKKVRGILCRKCNLGLGHFEDSPHLLVEAILYLTGCK